MSAALIIARHLDAASLDTRTQAAADACCAGAAALREAAAEVERLRAALRRQDEREKPLGAHSDICWSFGARHYGCALREINRLRLAKLERPQIRRLLRADGSSMELPRGKCRESLRQMIGADTLDAVTLRHMGDPLHVMLVDDLGHEKGLAINDEATRLYWAECRPGTTHMIVGDVVIVPDADFA